ncbi:metallophosphoesterase [Alteromonas sp. D210916BOD_24]|uniref:metallophosphoesterase family protein n=1 Tax=Alteromonas sp. D210916BOD_24 TaxID=3157618 RepID=UPI00399CDD1A
MKLLSIEKEPFYQIPYLTSGKGGKPDKALFPIYKAYVEKLPEGGKPFVVVSDLQGREDAKSNRLIGELVADELSLLRELEEIPNVQLVALCGDLYDYPDFRKRGGTGDVTSVWNAFAKEFEQVIGVHGNHDQVQEDMLSENITILDGDEVTTNGIRFSGVSGIIGERERNQRKTEKTFLKLLKKSCDSASEIILLHQGPNDLVNDQFGNEAINALLSKNGESLIVFGHCHWTTPFVELGDNQLLNADGRAFIIQELTT